ncbi:hypothetical protein Fmac_016219 [Flemingia macrophylla]|uniref:PXMP2/4 family protein 4 n=1 Tax=Flemingia macrophylla TaxID=520843 RepID=A0ABD1MGS8_9FABA
MSIHVFHISRAAMTNAASTAISRHILSTRFFLGHRFPPPLPPRLPKTQRRPPTPMPIVVSFSSSSSSPSPSRNSPFVAWYLRMLQSHPLATKSITSSIIFASADVTSQIIALPSFSASYDILRTFRMAVYGLLILGPSQHKWFNYLSKILPEKDVTSTLKKILMGQAIFGPIINTVFFTYNGVLQGENGPEIIARLKRDLLPTLLGGALFWPVCDFVTFRFLPVHLQPLLNSSCAYVWTIYLTYIANRA